MSAPVEVTTKYVTTVDDLPGAWAFVMEYLDRAGDRPSITISPLSVSVDGDEWTEHFEVVVSGRTKESGGGNDGSEKS